MTEHYKNDNESKEVDIERDVLLALQAIAEQFTHSQLFELNGDLVDAEAALEVAESALPYQEKIIEQNKLESLQERANALGKRISAFRERLNEKKNSSTPA